jgi:transposase
MGSCAGLETLRDVNRGGLTVSAAAQLFGRSERQVWRLLKAFRSDGAAGLISKKRGRPSNRKTAAAMRAAALWIVRQTPCCMDQPGGRSDRGASRSYAMRT